MDGPNFENPAAPVQTISSAESMVTPQESAGSVAASHCTSQQLKRSRCGTAIASAATGRLRGTIVGCLERIREQFQNGDLGGAGHCRKFLA
jgi:hypothetical protein